MGREGRAFVRGQGCAVTKGGCFNIAKKSARKFLEPIKAELSFRYFVDLSNSRGLAYRLRTLLSS